MRRRLDVVLREEVKCVYQVSRRRYGARKVWLQLVREGPTCTVERLMRL